jgi:hypothetical protein
MAKWNSSITSINVGVSPNDGTGDEIRTAFIYTDENFQELNTYLSSDLVEFPSIKANNGTLSNLVVGNTIGNNGAFTSNLFVNTLNAPTVNVTANLVATGQADFYNYIVPHTDIVPSGNSVQNLGSPTHFFGNIYAGKVISSTQVAASSDAGILLLHANLSPGDIKDIGVLGKYNKNSSNAYAYFGLQYQTNDFIYKVVDYDVSISANSVVSGGVYGNIHVGSLFLSNVGTANALIMSGNSIIYGTAFGNINSQRANIQNLNVSGSINGNVHVDGFITVGSGSGVVVTTDMVGFGTFYQGGLITGDTRFLSVTQSTGLGSGAVRIDGGLSVLGNISAGILVGPLWGQIQTPDQPNITSLGVLPTLTANSIQATSVGVNSLTATGGTVSFQTFTASGNVAVANIAATQFNGTLQGLVALPAQPLITSLGTLSSLSVAGNIGAPTLNGNLNATSAVITNLYSDGHRFANGVPYITVTYANTSEITSNLVSGWNTGFNLTPTGIIAGSYGTTTYIPQVTFDSKGRATQAQLLQVSPITLVGSNGTGNVFVGGNLAITSTNGIVTTVGNGTFNLTMGQDLRNTGTPTFGSLTITNQIGTTSLIALQNVQAPFLVGSSVTAPTIGNTGTVLTGTIGTLSNAQPFITSLGTLTGLGVSGTTTLTGTSILTGNNVVAGNLTVTTPGSYFTNNVYIGGSLWVNGVTTTVDATAVTTNDLYYVAAANAVSLNAANGAGFITPFGSITLNSSNSDWNSNIGLRATRLFDNGNRVISTTTGTGNLTLSGSNITLTTIGPGVTTAGSTTAVPVVSTDTFGRVTGLTSVAIQNISTTASVQHASLGVGTAASGTTGEIRATNNITAYYSDDRLKTRLGVIDNALDKIDQLTGFYYEANETAQALGYEVKREVGVSAQDTLRQMPEIVAPAPIDEQYLTVRYEKFAPLLIEGIKELRRELKDIKRHLGLE